MKHSVAPAYTVAGVGGIGKDECRANAVKREKRKALKRCEMAIDAMVELMDMGFGTGNVQRVLDSLNHIRNQIENERSSIFGL